MENLEKVLRAFGELFKVVVDAFGPVPTAILIVLIMGIVIFLRIRSERQKDKEFIALIESHRHHVASLRRESRNLTILLYKERGWSDTAIEKILIESDNEDALDAREILETSFDDELIGIPDMSGSERSNHSKRDIVLDIGSAEDATREELDDDSKETQPKTPESK